MLESVVMDDELEREDWTITLESTLESTLDLIEEIAELEGALLDAGTLDTGALDLAALDIGVDD